MKSYYLFGKSANQLLVDKIHRACFGHLGLQSTHRLITSATDSVSLYHRLLNQENFGGASLEKPYHKCFPYVPRLGIANRLESINTIVKQDNFLVAYNTNYSAIAHCLDKHHISSAVLFGTQSLAHTIGHYLVKRNITITVMGSMKNHHTKRQSDNKKLHGQQLSKVAPSAPDLIISASAEHIDWHSHSDLFRKKPIVMDTNFCVEDTPLTKHAKTIGSTHIFNGSQYLILKSLEQNYLFTRRRIDEEFSKDLFSKEFFKQKESSKGS